MEEVYRNIPSMTVTMNNLPIFTKSFEHVIVENVTSMIPCGYFRQYSCIVWFFAHYTAVNFRFIPSLINF